MHIRNPLLFLCTHFCKDRTKLNKYQIKVALLGIKGDAFSFSTISHCSKTMHSIIFWKLPVKISKTFSFQNLKKGKECSITATMKTCNPLPLAWTDRDSKDSALVIFDCIRYRLTGYWIDWTIFISNWLSKSFSTWQEVIHDLFLRE